MLNHCNWPACSCRATGQYCSNRPKGKKPKPIARMSEKRKESIPDDKVQAELDAFFYLQLWRERVHICQCGCNQPIKHDLANYMFHHILEKRNYNQYRYCRWNILLLLKECHNAWEGLSTTRPLITNLRHKLLNLHEDGKLQPCSISKATEVNTPFTGET